MQNLQSLFWHVLQKCVANCEHLWHIWIPSSCLFPSWTDERWSMNNSFSVNLAWQMSHWYGFFFSGDFLALFVMLLLAICLENKDAIFELFMSFFLLTWLVSTSFVKKCEINCCFFNFSDSSCNNVLYGWLTVLMLFWKTCALSWFVSNSVTKSLALFKHLIISEIVSFFKPTGWISFSTLFSSVASFVPLFLY